MNRRIAIIPRHPGLKIFAKGIQSIARLTASEFRDLMKVMVFVVDNLLNKDLSEVYVRWNRMYLMSRFERFTESDLENFQIAINEWADLFITLFWDCSSGMKMPKLHSWIYHIVDAIRDFGAINGYTTETYESLHKTYVKIPYRLSNKKDVEMQIMKNIRRRAMILRNQVKETKTPRALTYTAKLFIINFSNITELCNQQKNNPNINETMRKGFKEFQNCLYEYLSELKKSFTEGSLIKIFGSVTLKNGAILRATNKFHGRPWFRVQSIARLTASEFRDLMKVMVFVVDNLLNKDLSEVYVRWNRMYLMSRFERFTESDLENFQIAINEWADLFITLFWDCSSGMKMPKLHSWIYHIVDAIRDFGAINGYTTETYESLHKTYVKIPYRLSNKKDVEMQIMKNIRRRAMILRNQVKKTKTPRALTYTAKLFIINFSNITELCNQQKNNPNINETMRKGFKEFQNCLYEYLSELKKSFTEGCLIKIFGSVILKNGAILRATNKFHGRPWFSNIAIAMNNKELSKYQSDKGICYAQTLLITEVNVPNESPFHLVLV
ncbi:hypothetical protein Glove_9g54 [Diversispora epigaea]|uniref:Uncharacterized protein n=1 Tax=Diversispora epigaea TaxID=1348612 RepID=A0A397JZU3_9GLOM|nr:hypothetical protein Glove_9g54 [Diversispora epigaea]